MVDWRRDAEHEPTELGYDPERKVTLTIGELVGALGNALHVASYAPEEPQWKVGDRAFVEVEVTGTDKGSVNFKFAEWKGTASFTLGADYLKEIE